MWRQRRGWFSDGRPVKGERQGGTWWQWIDGLRELASVTGSFVMGSDGRHCGTGCLVLGRLG